MDFKISISGGTTLEKSIKSVSLIVDPPNDFDDMFMYITSTVEISGIIGFEESIDQLTQWALLPVTDDNCYKEIIVEEFHESQQLRKYSFSKAFVVKYSESYTDNTGVGCFSLLVRQMIGIDIECTNEAGQSSKISEAVALPLINMKMSKEPKAVVSDVAEVTAKSWEEIKKEKSEELEKFVEEVNEKNKELKANNKDVYKKAAIMFDSKNPLCKGMAVPGNYKENPLILDEDEKFDKELFKGKFKSNYEDYYNNLMSQEYLESLSKDFYEKKGTDKDKVIREMKKLANKIEEVKQVAEKNGKKNIFGKYSLEENWNVENCAEVWAARKAILNGAEFNNLAFKCVHTSNGKYAKPCKNCSVTFKDNINLGKDR